MNKVELLTIIDETMPTLVKIVLSNAKKKSQEFQKIIGRKVLLKNEEMIQLEFFTKTQTMHKNISLALASEEIMKYATLYKQMDIFTSTHTYQIRMKDIEDIHVSKKTIRNKK